MLRKLLIANRGEIACRVIATAKRIGITTIAVYSDADANALHVQQADEAWHIGGPAPADSYLRSDRLLDVVVKSGADAVHPGYGFLSENAEFADAVAASGAVFVGPPANAIRAMGSKSEAKKIMAKAGVPLVPGYHGADQDVALLATEADKIGYPVLIKASAGGGGKGMRAVESAADFADALISCKREARSSFGDDHCLIEKLILHPRHVEIQVFADAHGNAVYLFERDCSLQRRHQKVIEEAPAPNMPEDLRTRMGKAAVDAARAIGYQGAGTVEFLLDASGDFYFMEMNTRLQVEHPVTEMITGEDLVEWQLRVADGETLPKTQDQLKINGHAFEVRLYAEDPHNDFLPATGKLVHMHMPAASPHVRIDTGVYQGGVVSIHYDPMIAKLIVWDQDRTSALRRLSRALDDVQIVGVTTNTGFLANIARHPAFERAEVETGFIPTYLTDLIPTATQPDNEALCFAALEILYQRDCESRLYANTSTDPWSPWHSTNGWRMNDDNHHNIILRHNEDDLTVKVHYRDFGYICDLPDGGTVRIEQAVHEDGKISATLDGIRKRADVRRVANSLTIFRTGKMDRLEIFDPAENAGANAGGGGNLNAPMPGKIIAVMAKTGDAVTAGDKLVIMEAMKMEHTISAPVSGTVREVYFAVGDQVGDGDELIAIEEA
ncbi:acetyl/propionyl/methylcrotonyl-CoA carboxylase subunit alpha [Thalassospira sp. MCCC 1A01428]|uniref:acetyl/propionyl/methylcrotonyl-CoA carboxylase subunit alpha n=1 Tax=Thalassospira sp. MCCC 1A01428 TaxID=1470575 RepID=UPI000A1DDAA6|nr:acetyl/propionyl/methylcrotonyl-CoA carboxylase subunit alpha [Thalassospira sp. MCCC 1A01428]OSQ44709.1 3-methylcrotonyl-CoA carboxylase [Thalassospira sp. MCCC 1A01428]